MQNKPFRLGPTALGAAAANLLNPGTTTGGVNSTSDPYGELYILLTHIRAVNKTNTPQSVSLFIGATGASAAGTEFAWAGTVIPANSALDWYGRVRLDTADFLTGLAGASASVTLEAEGEIGVA